MAIQTSISGVKLLLILLGVGFFIYILGPPLYWHFTGDEPGRLSASCPMCVCNCPPDSLTTSALADLRNVSLPDCSRDDPSMAKELQESRYKQLYDEMKVQESVAQETQRRLEDAHLEAKKTASQYQKEFEKCNSGMETSEGAREKAEALLVQEKKSSAMWEARARELGWKDDGKAESGESATSKKPKSDERSTPQSKKNKKEIADLQSNLAVAQYLVQRAVSNEMGNLEVAREHAAELNLL